MKQAGDIVLTHFPMADLAEGKLRPALLLVRSWFPIPSVSRRAEAPQIGRGEKNRWRV